MPLWADLIYPLPTEYATTEEAVAVIVACAVLAALLFAAVMGWLDGRED
mgnify:CR=1 FL=1